MAEPDKDDIVAALTTPPADPIDEKPQLASSKFVDEQGNVILEKRADRIIQLSEWLDDLRADGYDPDDFYHSHGHSVWTQHTRNQITKTLYSNKFTATLKASAKPDIPKWPVVQQAAPVVIKPTATIKKVPKLGGWKTAIVGSDTQFGFRFTDVDETELFHDEDAISVFHQIVALENPDQTVIAGDILDLSQQGKFTQEAGFARTTQLAIDRTTTFAAQLRADTSGKIVFIEGNHDRRMQNFVEANALSALGLKQGNWPESYPVMSLPFLLRLDEFDIEYKDAYPSAHHWINENLRVEHGDRSNANGSTAEKYARETPHFSRVFGHSHRLEVVSRTTYDRQGKRANKFVNTGCLCRIDGTVPGYHASIGANGKSAPIVENWQHGLAVFRYRDDGEFFVNLVGIEDGLAVYEGQEIRSLA